MTKLKEILLMLGITLVLLILIELVVRLTYDGAPEPKPVDISKLAYDFHPDYLIKMKSNMVKRFRRDSINGADVIDWKSNAHGFRGNPPNDTAKVRIMVFGDSNIQGRFSKLDNTYCEQIRKHLSDSNTSVEVLNTGIIGLGPDQSLIKMMQDVPKFDPDVIIFHVFADNDFGDIMRNRLFDIDQNGDLFRTNFPITRDEKISPNPPSPKPFFRTVELLNSIRNKATNEEEKKKEPNTQSLIDLYLGFCEKEYEAYKDKKERVFSHFADHYDLDLAAFPNSEVAKIKKQLMEKVVLAAAKYADEQNKPFLVVVQPSVIDMTENFDITLKHLAKYEDYNPRYLSKIPVDVCLENDIPVVDLYEEFIDHEPSSLFFRGRNNHWNDEGQKLAADRTVRVIKKILPE